ncbi:MAG: ribonuclease P protein component [Victivallaceae bacterium]
MDRHVADEVSPAEVPEAFRTRSGVKTLRKAEKLRFKSEFDLVRGQGTKFVGKGMLAVVAPSPDGLCRCGVICGKKYSLLSVERNRARRLLWESFRLLKSEMTPCHLVLIPRRLMADWKRPQATREMAVLLGRAKVLSREFVESPPEC